MSAVDPVSGNDGAKHTFHFTVVSASQRLDGALKAKSNAIEFDIREADARQFIAVDGAGVDPDSLGSNEWLREGCVTKDHGLAEIIVREDELVSNPEQILLLLLIQGYARAKPGVDQDEFIHFKIGLQM